jgi:hypothetical protein
MGPIGPSLTTIATPLALNHDPRRAGQSEAFLSTKSSADSPPIKPRPSANQKLSTRLNQSVVRVTTPVVIVTTRTLALPLAPPRPSCAHGGVECRLASVSLTFRPSHPHFTFTILVTTKPISEQARTERTQSEHAQLAPDPAATTWSQRLRSRGKEGHHTIS